MVRSILIFICAAVCVGQTPKEPPKPPADVDQALRARVQEFFQYHVTGQFRKAEALVAEDSKDLFYNRNKPRYLKFVEIARIDYSENFTKAVATVMVVSPEMIAGWGGGPPSIPIPSTWKLEDGKWCWYLDPDVFLHTPFGSIPVGTMSSAGSNAPGQLPPGFDPSVLGSAGAVPGASSAGIVVPGAPVTVAAGGEALPNVPPPAGGAPGPTPDPAAMAAIAGARQLGMSPAGMPGMVPQEALGLIKPDKTTASLNGEKPDTITFSNSATDGRSLMLLGGLAGVEAKFDHTDVAPGKTAVLTLKAAKDAKSGSLLIVVPQTAEMFRIQVKIN
jgi:hypothetical protein